MKTCSYTIATLAWLVLAPAASAAIVTDVPIGGEFLEVDQIIGAGANTAYVVLDFAGERNGNEITDVGPQDFYAFGFRYDPAGPPQLTLGDMLDALDTDGAVGVGTSGLVTDAGGRGLDRLAVGTDEVELVPSFAGGSFWSLFLYDQGAQDWAFANSGIDARTFGAPSSQDPGADTILADGNVYGLIPDVFTNATQPVPRIPTAALSSVPEPSTLATLGLLGCWFAAFRRRRR